MSEELKPCPVCDAGRPILRHWDAPGAKYHTMVFECATCRTRSPEAEAVTYEIARAAAVVKWNAMPRRNQLFARLEERIAEHKYDYPDCDGVRMLVHEVSQLVCANENNNMREVHKLALWTAVVALRLYEDTKGA